MKAALDLGLTWKALFGLMVAVLVTTMPDVALAQSYDDYYGIGLVMCNAMAFFFGNAGKGLATIAIAVLGVGALFGKVSWGLATIIGAGIGIIFGAPSIFYAIAGRHGCLQE